MFCAILLRSVPPLQITHNASRENSTKDSVEQKRHMPNHFGWSLLTGTIANEEPVGVELARLQAVIITGMVHARGLSLPSVHFRH